MGVTDAAPGRPRGRAGKSCAFSKVRHTPQMRGLRNAAAQINSPPREQADLAPDDRRRDL